MAGVLELVIILVVLYWVFNARASAMVDVLSARLQAVYAKWDREPKTREDGLGSPSSTEKISASTLRRYAFPNKGEKLKTLSSDNVFQSKDREIFRSKESPWIVGFPARPSRPVMGLACKACTPESKDFSIDYAAKNQEVRNILKTEAEKSSSFLTRAFCHLVHVWKLKKFDFPQVTDKVLASDTLKSAIENTTKELVERSIKEDANAKSDNEEVYKKVYMAQEARAKRILKDMRSTLSDLLLRITTWLLYKLFPRFLTSVCLHPSHLSMLQKAASTNLPLIFIPLHRSHLDYILITFILQNIRVKAPLVAAGNNLRIPVFGALLRGLGAFFIKRRIDPVTGKKDILYRAILQSYMMECLRAGHNIEFYIEGGRTRTGKPCMPKGGLLSVIIGAYMDGTVEDALLVPVSVNYDKLVDGNFVNELLGQPKQMETFSSAISAIWTTLNSNYGSIRIDFNQPFSLRELIKSFQSKSGRLSQSDIFSSNESEVSGSCKRNGFQKEKSFRSIPSTTSLYGTDVIDENHRAIVDKIARHLIYDCTKACAIMSTNTLAFLLLNKYRNGVSVKELTVAFDKLRQQLSLDRGHVGFSGESSDVIEHALKLLGPDLVKREKINDNTNADEATDFITPITVLPNVINLSYYSNALLPHFMLEGVVATAICCSLKNESPSVLTVGMDDIIRNALDLCGILQFEFVFAKPCESLEFVISETIDKFKFMDILSTQETSTSRFEKWSQTLAKSLDDSEDDEFHQYKPSPIYIISNAEEEEEKLEFFHMLLRPFIDTYMASAMCLHTLVSKQLPENEFVLEVLAEISSRLVTGLFPYGESSSVEAIKNALKLFKKWGVVEIYNEDSVRVVRLTDPYNDEEELQRIHLCKSNPWHEIIATKRLESFDAQDWINHEAAIPYLPEHLSHRVNLTSATVLILGKHKLKETLLRKFAEVVERENPRILHEEEEIRKLGNIFCGFSQFHMYRISDNVLQSLWDFNFFQSVRGCAREKLDILLKKLQKKGIVGSSKTWDSETVIRLGILVSGLPPEDFKKIRLQTMSSISPEVIRLTPPDTLKEIFTDQLQSLSRESLLQWRRTTKDSRPLYAKSTLISCNINLLMLSCLMYNVFI